MGRKRKLSVGQRRSELIANFASVAPPAPVAAPADTTYAPEPYTPDDAETVVCPSCEKHNSTDASFCDQCGEKLTGNPDVVQDASPAPVADTKAPMAAADTQSTGGPVANANPVSDEGDVQNGVVCTTPDCGHTAALHGNTDGGANTGACLAEGCTCEAMNVDTAETDNPNDSDAAETGTDNDAGPAEPDGTPSGDVTLNPPPDVPGGESMGPAFSMVLVIEGQPTGDGRTIAPDALTWRMPPLQLMGLATETHDPEGWDLNDPAVACGRIDSLTRQAGEGETQLIIGKGFFLPNDDGMYFAELVEAMGRMGVSADIAVNQQEMQVDQFDDDGWPIDMSSILTDGTIMGGTVCPFPAFAGCYIVLGDDIAAGAVTPIPQDVPAMVASAPPKIVRDGGQVIHYMTYAECAACDQGIEVIVASGGPLRPPKAWFANPMFTPGDGRLEEIYGNRDGLYGCPVTVTDEGRVYGHIATWEVCHIGFPGCVTAPHSQTDYAHFKRGQHVVTAEGDRIRVGSLTVDGPHARIQDTPAQAMAHYDNTLTQAADVNAGEDEYGIWIAGAIRPSATPEQVRTLRASSLSGDWRNEELVAALAVPVPGFPLSLKAGDTMTAMVASGAQVMYRLKNPVERTVEQGDVVLRAALRPMLQESARRARERIAAAR